MVLKQLGMASVSIQAGVEGFLELEPNSNTRFLSGRTVLTFLLETSKSSHFLLVACRKKINIRHRVLS